MTSAEGYGQIYVGAVNWLPVIATLGLTIGFAKSDNFAAAYGIAVSLTMRLTSALFFIAMPPNKELLLCLFRFPKPLCRSLRSV